MYVKDAYRSRGLAQNIIASLESYATVHGIQTICLETGYLQVAALNVYCKRGYVEIARFGNYQPNSVSVYLKKEL